MTTLDILASGALVKKTEAIKFIAKDVHKERTGVHAKVALLSGDRLIGHDYFNLGKHADRVRLANASYAQLDPVAQATAMSKEQVLYDLSIFCLDVEQYLDEQWLPIMSYGSEERAPPAFFLEPYIMQGAGTLLFAPPKQGKSYIFLLMAISIDAGVNSLWPTQQGKVLVINLERSRSSVEQRIGNINRALGLDPNRGLLTIHARGQSLSTVRSAAKQAVSEGVVAVFVDSISRAGAGGSMTADDVGNRIIDMLNDISSTWVALAHTPRADDSHVYGSVMMEAGEDIGIRLACTKSDAAMGIALNVTHANDMVAPPVKMYSLYFDRAGLTNVEVAPLSRYPDLSFDKNQKPTERIEQYLKSIGKATTTEVAKQLGLDPGNVSRYFRQSEIIREVAREGNAVYYGIRAGDLAGEL